MEQAKTEYTARRDRFAREAHLLNRRGARLGNLRLLTFLVGAGAFLAPIVTNTVSFWPYLFAFSVVVFVVLVSIHNRVDRELKRAEEGRRIQEEALARLERDWDRVPEPRLPLAERPAFARDLDLFGHASLWKLLGTVSTPLGKSRLSSWLLDPAPPETVLGRQQAVRELAPRLEFRQELQLRSRTMERLDPDCEPFLRWAEDEPQIARQTALRVLARILPLVVWGLLFAALAGALPHSLWMLAALVNLGVAYAAARKTHGVFHRVSAREGEFRGYARALEHLAAELVPGEGSASAHLGHLAEQLAAGGLLAHRQMERLHGLVNLADVRHSGSLHMPLQAFFLWDIHVLERLERWQVRAGRSARAWLEALGEVEALCALAGLGYDEPEWSFPELVEPASPEEVELVAARLGHPLLSRDVRVENDVTVGPPGSFLLITGSNMSGKSTLIRALGLNVVLAQAGGPVCAEKLRLPPVELGTSVLIEDSLEDGVSFFMAELQRIKQLVDRSGACRARGRTLFYLMDEILRGTNSFERQAAVRKVLVHLLGQGSIGAISTHDLNLADIDELAPASRPVHFRETLENAPGRPVMSFDYRLRQGVATTRNALKLLELVGLELEEASA